MPLKVSKTTASSQHDALPRFKLLEAMTRDFTDRLRREFAQEVTSNPKPFKTYLLRLVRRALPPRRGRPNDPRIDAAMRMIEQRRTINDVLRAQISDFEKLDSGTASIRTPTLSIS